MTNAWAEVVGGHRPLVLDATQDVMPEMAVRNDDAVILTNAWPASNRAFLVRVRNPRAFTPTHAYVHNGNTVAGNLDIGVYGFTARSNLELLISTGATAQAGVNTVQHIALTAPPRLPAGPLVLAISLANTGGIVGLRNWIATYTTYERLMSVGQLDSNHPLAANIAGVSAPTSGWIDIPIFGVCERLY